MVPWLAQFIDLLHQTLPFLAVLVTALFAGILHQRNRQLRRAQFQLAEKIDDMANADVKAEIADLEAKVASDDKERLELQSSIPGFGSGNGNDKPRR